MTIQVHEQDLGSAASAVSAIAGDLRGVDVAGPFQPITTALVGSRTSEATLWLGTRLAAAVEVYASRIDAYGHAVSGSGSDITAVDSDTASGLGGGR